ncbi:MAG TPA: dienelactone hydrolase family protein [Pyrinomonadaceae bacterium]|nr:dienelactone hydrolase family protein [Pyrinomonadaceae bacterium]
MKGILKPRIHPVALAFCFILGVAAISRVPAQEILKRSILSQGKKREYYLFIPKVIQRSSVPVIVLLHGSGHDGASLVEKWKSLAERETIILVGPTSDSSAGWQMPRDGPEFLYDLVEALRVQYPVNSRRIYLFGHSAGAVFALYMSMYESQFFAATALDAGALPLGKYSVMEKAHRKIPIAISTGTDDEYFPLNVVQTTVKALRSKDFPVELTVRVGQNHTSYYNFAPEIDRAAWEFLSKFELSTDPQYAPY